MEILIGVGSVLLSLFITVLSVKLAAGWLGAERNGWGHCIAALLLAYITVTAMAVATAIGAGLLPEQAGMIVAAAVASPGSYAYRDVVLADAAAHVGRLVRVTLADGSWHRDQLVAVDGPAMTLKRGKSEGGGRYSIVVADIVRMEVFDR